MKLQGLLRVLSVFLLAGMTFVTLGLGQASSEDCGY
jgi:hypothetical protein